MTFPKPYADAVARLRVPSGFLLVAAFAYAARPTVETLAMGFPVSLLGLLIRAWAAGHLEKNQQLAEAGPYAFVRNPLYLGTLIAAIGLAIAANRWELGLLFASVFFGVYLPVIQNEEQHLRKLFPSYDEYATRVPALLPRITPSARLDRHFRFSQYLKNEEYQAGIGFLVGAAWLVWRAL